jgi:hypothetical protein
MTHALGRRAVCAWPVCLVLALGACGAGGSSTQSSGGPGGRGGPPRGGDSAPPRDTFMGSIISGAGAYADRHQAVVKVFIHPHGSGERRLVRLVFASRCGGSSSGCISLNGTAQGRLTGSPRGVPDVGRSYSLSATGRIGSLGRVLIRGEVVGTGFISHAHELLKLTLTAMSGQVTIVAYSAMVKGFTSP